MKTYEKIFDEEGVRQLVAAGVDVPSKESMTCSKCEDVAECEFAWDLYNTDGDCLAIK